MSLATPTAISNKPRISTPGGGWLVVTTLALALIATAATLAYDRIFHHGKEGVTAQTIGITPVDGEPDIDLKTTVALPEGKFKTAGIVVEPVQEVQMPREIAVTGKIEADPNRKAEIRPRASGIVRTVPVLPGTKVKAGDVLVVLDSPDVGSARLKVRERQRELATVRVEATWKAEIADNVETMIKGLRDGASARDLAKQFASKSMGTWGGTLISSWADVEIAAHEYEKMSDLNKKNIVGEHNLFLAEHTREGAQAKFKGALEQVRFDVSQQDRIARQTVRNAEEMVVDAAQRLRILGVAEDINELLAHPEKASALPSGSEDLLAYSIVAPLDGTVVSTFTARSQRAEPTDLLFLVADLSKVYAIASIPESDFAAIKGLSGGKVRLVATAYPDRHFDAKMIYTSAEVDPKTLAVRLVAETDNPDGLLKLGMFTRILLDTTTTENALTVPAAAIVEVEGRPAVFVPGKEERTYVIRHVKLGREALGRQVITEGLKPSSRVVVAGAFLIKSELVLQNETEED